MRNRIVIFILCCLFFPISLQASCFWLGVGEFVIPGLGYIGTGQWDKVIVFGASRWGAYQQYSNARYDLENGELKESEYYQDGPDKIYKSTNSEDSESGKEEMDVYMNRETWQANFYTTLYSNLTLMSAWDLYQNCSPNSEIYSMSLAPLKIHKFIGKWYFLLPIAILAYANNTFDDNQVVRWHLGRGLKESEIRNDSFPLYYSVGVGEEMFFRGTLQDYFYFTMNKSWGWSASVSRHLSVWSGAAIFGLAHQGTGFTATPSSAFLMGAYLGYVYQPSINEFDLTTAIALHTWWDIIVAYTIINHSTFVESEDEVQIPLASIAFKF